MNRRGFLGTLLATLGATAIDPNALLWAPRPDAIDVLDADALVTLTQITKAILHEITIRRADTALLRVQPTLVGHVSERGHTFNHQYHVSMAAPPSELDHHGLDHERYVKRIASALNHRIGQIEACGTLEHPRGDTIIQCATAFNEASGLSLRGLACEGFHPDTSEWTQWLRFDMIVAS